MNNKMKLIIAMMICTPLVGLSENSSTNAMAKDELARARIEVIEDVASFHKMVDVSAEIYTAVVKGKHGEVPSGVLSDARCIAILPNVITGALLVGGTHGEGLASCKKSDNSWTQPVAISLNQASLGLQAGGKSVDLILFFQNVDSEKALKKGDFALGTDVSAVAGKFNRNVDTSNAGVIVYTRSEGLFAGASVTGGVVGKDQSNLDIYYGKNVDYQDVLEGREAPDSTGYTEKLTKLFPR